MNPTFCLLHSSFILEMARLRQSKAFEGKLVHQSATG
jgi:hypothetical protein